MDETTTNTMDIFLYIVRSEPLSDEGTKGWAIAKTIIAQVRPGHENYE